MIYFIITTSLIENCFELRKREYIQGINSVLDATKDIPNTKIIIVENNGKRDTFLDNFRDSCEILYTESNNIENNKGHKEIVDVKICIYHYNIQPDDFVVKFTGRYFILTDGFFMNTIRNANDDFTNIDAIIKYGWWQDLKTYKIKDCITGLIGMKCKHVLNIELNKLEECIEWKWAETSLSIPDDKTVVIPEKMGLIANIAQGGIFYL
jgi:hypothetical protein